MYIYIIGFYKMPIFNFWIRFPFSTTHYVAAYKTIHMYYLRKSHDSLNRSCD